MIESTNGTLNGMVDRGRFATGRTLRAIQQGELFVYAILTNEGAVKIGSTTVSPRASAASGSVDAARSWRSDPGI